LFNDRTVKQAGEKAVQWAWAHLYPPLTDTLEIGSGLDLGYIKGFYGPETDKDGQTYRWMTGHAEVRNIFTNADYGVALSGWRPDGAPLPGRCRAPGGRVP
jgi:hypothetical protein